MSEPTPITRATLDFEALQKPQGHKYTHGHALILSGGPGQTGAARLAARAALRVGAGAVTIGVPPSAQMEVAVQITSIMLRRVSDAHGLEKVLEDPRLNALCLGPGLGLGDERRDLIEVALKSRRACVLDADALTLVAGSAELFNMLHADCVLTPHGGEFARLYPDLAEDQADKSAATRAAAERSGCTVLYKGADTFIAAPDGTIAHHAATGDRAVPWLATAGAGDVLAGMIAGLMARGCAATVASQLSCWLHVEAARSFGAGLIAEDLPEELPKVFGKLGL